MSKRCKVCGAKVRSKDSALCNACEDDREARKYSRLKKDDPWSEGYK
jgi:hypothetical protein